MPVIERLTNDIVGEARQIYQERLKDSMETPENVGKFITIDTVSGAYEIGTDNIVTVRSLKARYPEAVTCTLRIGYPATFSRGARMKPVQR